MPCIPWMQALAVCLFLSPADAQIQPGAPDQPTPEQILQLEEDSKLSCAGGNESDCEQLVEIYNHRKEFDRTAYFAGVLCRLGLKSVCRSYLKNNPERETHRWQEAFKKNLSDRVGPLPAHLVDHLVLDNYANGYTEIPRPADQVPANFTQEILEILESLPAPLKAKLQLKLAGIFLLRQLGSTAYSLSLLNSEKRAESGLIGLDVDLLQKKANEWASWKESTPFLLEDSTRIRVILAEGKDDVRKTALRYILLHEIAHVISFGEKFVPSTIDPFPTPEETQNFTYLPLSWRGGTMGSEFDPDFAERKSIRFYTRFPRPAAAEHLAKIYEKLEKTNFPTLYAATNPEDDFADSFANYIHVVTLKKPYAVEVLKGGKVVKKTGPCWSEPRCQKKREFFEKLLGVTANPS